MLVWIMNLACYPSRSISQKYMAAAESEHDYRRTPTHWADVQKAFRLTLPQIDRVIKQS